MVLSDPESYWLVRFLFERGLAVRYRYEFTSRAERRETGRWWSRERVGTYVEPTSLDDVRVRRRLV